MAVKKQKILAGIILSILLLAAIGLPSHRMIKNFLKNKTAPVKSVDLIPYEDLGYWKIAIPENTKLDNIIIADPHSLENLSARSELLSILSENLIFEDQETIIIKSEQAKKFKVRFRKIKWIAISESGRFYAHVNDKLKFITNVNPLVFEHPTLLANESILPVQVEIYNGNLVVTAFPQEKYRDILLIVNSNQTEKGYQINLIPEVSNRIPEVIE